MPTTRERVIPTAVATVETVPHTNREHWAKFIGDVSEGRIVKLSFKDLKDAGVAYSGLQGAVKKAGLAAKCHLRGTDVYVTPTTSTTPVIARKARTKKSAVVSPKAATPESEPDEQATLS